MSGWIWSWWFWLINTEQNFVVFFNACPTVWIMVKIKWCQRAYQWRQAREWFIRKPTKDPALQQSTSHEIYKRYRYPKNILSMSEMRSCKMSIKSIKIQCTLFWLIEYIIDWQSFCLQQTPLKLARIGSKDANVQEFEGLLEQYKTGNIYCVWLYLKISCKFELILLDHMITSYYSSDFTS